MKEDSVESVKTSNNYNKEEWKKKKQEQLQNAYNLIEEATEDIGKNPLFFKSYLDIQSRFDKYTVRNALLVAKQMPNALRLKDYNNWKKLNVNFNNKFPKKILILEPGNAYVNKNGKKTTPYNAKEVIDVSETDYILKEKNYDKRIILQAILHDSPIAVKVVDSLPNNKICEWNKEKNIINFVRNDDYSYDLIIKSILKELVKADITKLSDNFIEEKSLCTCYMICKKYNVDIELNDIDKISQIFSNKTSKEIKKDLSEIKEIQENINNHIYNYLEENGKKKENQNVVR